MYVWNNKKRVFRINWHILKKVLKDNMEKDILDVPQEECWVNFNILKRERLGPGVA
jgi:hypothetical protein